MPAKKRKSNKKPKQAPWFIKIRGSYLPNSWQGWLTYIPFITYLVLVLIAFGGQDGPLLNRVILICGQFVMAAVVMTWIATKHS